MMSHHFNARTKTPAPNYFNFDTVLWREMFLKAAGGTAISPQIHSNFYLFGLYLLQINTPISSTGSLNFPLRPLPHVLFLTEQRILFHKSRLFPFHHRQPRNLHKCNLSMNLRPTRNFPLFIKCRNSYHARITIQF